MSHHISNNDPKQPCQCATPAVSKHNITPKDLEYGGYICIPCPEKANITPKDLENGDYCSCYCHPHTKKIYIPIPSTWGNIVGDIKDQTDLIELLQTISSTSAEKEVIRVSTYSSTAPSEPDEGDLYINSSQNILYSFDGEKWVAGEDNPDAVYVTEDANHIYVYSNDQSKYIDVTGQAIDDVIYVTNLVEDLNPYTDEGIYKVCYIPTASLHVWYTMAVTVTSSNGNTLTTQILHNRDGYGIRTALSPRMRWSGWAWYKYAFEGRNAKKPQLEISFSRKQVYADGGCSIIVRDKNNVIQEDDHIVLYYWDRKHRRISAFAGGEGSMQIFPIRWGSISQTSKVTQKGWRDDWRVLPYSVADIMQRITYLTPAQLDTFTWEGGYRKTLLGNISFVGGARGNSYCTRLWIGVARDLTYVYKNNHVEHFSIGELMHRMPFYIRCYHRPGYSNYQKIKGTVLYHGSCSRKPHLWFGKDELTPWQPVSNNE